MRIFAWLSGLAAAMAASSALAAPASGPAWWRVSNGAGANLHILAIPDGMLVNDDWSVEELTRRIGVARLVVIPLLGDPPSQPDFSTGPSLPPGRSSVGSPPYMSWCAPDPTIPQYENYLGAYPPPPGQISSGPPWEYSLSTVRGGLYGQETPVRCLWDRGPGGWDRTFDDPLSRRLPPALLSRSRSAFGPAPGNIRTGLNNAKTWELALWLDVWNWPRGKLGNPATTKAQAIAQNRSVKIEQLYLPALWRPILADAQIPPPEADRYPGFNWLWMLSANRRTPPPEAVQQRCLAEALVQTESGQMPALRAAAQQAWARGDLTRALRRSNNLQYCLMGDQPSSDAQSFVKKQAYLYIQSLDKAFDQPGDTVALVEFDPLLLESGGVIDHFARLGYEIAKPPGAP